MPKILRVELTSDQEREVRERLRARDLAPGTRLRLDCIRLMGRGMTVPEVADLLECNDVTVRGAVHRFAAGGFEALTDDPRPGRPASVTREDREALAALLDESALRGRTWTAAALCDWLAAERGVRVSAAWLTELLHRDGFRWKRTRDTLRHKADPVLQQAARARLEDLRLDAHAGVRDLYFLLDESGFAPTMPTGYTWSWAGQRAVVPREDKKGRRVNVLGALSVGQHADLVWERTCGKIDAVMLLEFVCTSLARLPGGAAALERPPAGFTRVRPCTVVLDNASTHVARIFKGRREELAGHQRRTLLPPASQSRAERHRAGVALSEVRGLPRTRPHHRRHGRHRRRPRPEPSADTHQRISSQLHQSRFSAVAALRERVRGIGGPRLVGQGHGHGCAVSDARRGRP